MIFFVLALGCQHFSFFYLYHEKKSPIIAGIIVGISVVIFRILLGLYTYDISFLFQQNYPTFFYYFTFGTLYQLTKANRYITKPIFIGILGITFDILASLGELIFQYISFNSIFSRESIHKISIIAIFRSFLQLVS